MTKHTPRESANIDVAIIGAGFGGLGLGARLRQAGRDDFLIFDAAAGVGGTWWVNRYPGCACDVPSHLYSLSFFPNPDWSRWFAPRAEIQAYLERLVGHFNLASRLRLRTRITNIQWDAQASRWRLRDAFDRIWRASVVVSAIGGLSRPNLPSIPGLDRFEGQMVHSQQWDNTLRWKGSQVALIGTGASAAQIAPEIAPQVEKLDVYQRTPHWILPRPDRAIGPRRRGLYRRLPLARKLVRFGIWAISEARVPGLVWSTRLAAGHRLLARTHRRRQIKDPELRAALTPDYDIGCKRVILSSD
ncbi:MAG: flavin-containing monooxygenase, partial [Wenzhouxiangellaceae bacterium]